MYNYLVQQSTRILYAACKYPDRLKKSPPDYGGLSSVGASISELTPAGIKRCYGHRSRHLNDYR